MKISIELIKKSIAADYLPENFITLIRERMDKLTETDSGYYALRSITVTTADGYTYHEEHDSDLFVLDEWNEEYICECDAVQAHGRRRNLVVTNKDNCIYFEGNYYLENYLDDNGIITLHNGDYCHIDEARYVEDEGEYYHGDDVYYWESDNEYHLEPEEEETTLKSSLRDKDNEQQSETN
jgi:hypothetical protein